MEWLVEFVGSILLEFLQELWPPVLAVVTGALVLFFSFLAWVFFSQGELAKAAISLVAAFLFLGIGIAGAKNGIYNRKNRSGRRKR